MVRLLMAGLIGAWRLVRQAEQQHRPHDQVQGWFFRKRSGARRDRRDGSSGHGAILALG